MTDEVAALFRLAGESHRAAGILLENGLFRFSASRSYYTMFYAAKALLLTDGQSYARHSAVISAFGRTYAKSQRLDEKFHTFLRKAFEDRQRGDYQAMQIVGEETARLLLDQAREFLHVAAPFLRGSNDLERR